ncbi:hypothetical protein AX16_000902 [Volvariella volvacea WC 439]|nr:hypothetical protein AX16_000902 [Volvariella volvacea WC 439]
MTRINEKYNAKQVKAQSVPPPGLMLGKLGGDNPKRVAIKGSETQTTTGMGTSKDKLQQRRGFQANLVMYLASLPFEEARNKHSQPRATEASSTASNNTATGSAADESKSKSKKDENENANENKKGRPPACPPSASSTNTSRPVQVQVKRESDDEELSKLNRLVKRGRDDDDNDEDESELLSTKKLRIMRGRGRRICPSPTQSPSPNPSFISDDTKVGVQLETPKSATAGDKVDPSPTNTPSSDQDCKRYINGDAGFATLIGCGLDVFVTSPSGVKPRKNQSVEPCTIVMVPRGSVSVKSTSNPAIAIKTEAETESKAKTKTRSTADDDTKPVKESSPTPVLECTEPKSEQDVGNGASQRDEKNASDNLKTRAQTDSQGAVRLCRATGIIRQALLLAQDEKEDQDASTSGVVKVEWVRERLERAGPRKTTSQDYVDCWRLVLGMILFCVIDPLLENYDLISKIKCQDKVRFKRIPGAAHVSLNGLPKAEINSIVKGDRQRPQVDLQDINFVLLPGVPAGDNPNFFLGRATTIFKCDSSGCKFPDPRFGDDEKFVLAHCPGLAGCCEGNVRVWAKGALVVKSLIELGGRGDYWVTSAEEMDEWDKLFECEECHHRCNWRQAVLHSEQHLNGGLSWRVCNDVQDGPSKAA